MKKIILSFLVLALAASSLFAQTPREVSGIVVDTTGTGVFGATIKLFPLNGPGDTTMIRTNIDGIFVMKNVKLSQFTLSITSLGYANFVRKYNYTDGASRIVLDKITLKEGANVLQEVTINGAPPVTVKEDTVEYRAADFKMKEGAVLEDLIKRVDGVEVDKDGNATSKGKAITKIKIDGKEQFGGDFKTATKNIPVDMIDKLQIVEDYGDQAAFTGVKDGEAETIINITTRPGRNNGYIANGTAGGGANATNGASGGLYQLSAFANQFKGDKSMGFNANINNNNTAISGGGVGGRAGGGGGGGFQGGGGANAAGLNTVSSVGLNYGNKVGKVQFNMGYFFNYSDNDINRFTNGQTNRVDPLTSSATTIFNTGNTLSGTTSYGNSMFGRITYSINPKNQLVIMPSFGFTTVKGTSDASTFQTGALRQDQTTLGKTKSTSPNLSLNVLYNHLFAKARRNYSLNLNVRNSAPESTVDNNNHIIYYNASTGSLVQDSLNRRYNETNNQQFSGQGRFVYTEPLNLASRMQFSYNVNYNNYDNSRITSGPNALGVLTRIDSLSNIYQYSFTSHQFGVNYNYKNQYNELSLGLTANPTILSGESKTLNTSISRNNFFLAPILRYTYRYSRTKSVQLFYNGRAQEPQFNQLQPVRDVTNPQRPIVGNPNLNSSFVHSLNGDYNTSNVQKHTTFQLRFNANLNSNAIVTNQVQIPDVNGSYKLETRYLNADGNHSFGGAYVYSKSFKDRAYVLRLSGNASSNTQVAFLESKKNEVQSFGYTQKLSFQIFNSWLEFAPGFSYGNSKSTFSATPTSNTTIQTYGFDGYGRVLFLKSKTLILGFDASKLTNSGYSSAALNTSPFILNSYIEKQFMKNKQASFRLSAFDLLKQSNNIQFQTTATGFTESRTNRLTQYFMMTLRLQLNKFGGVSMNRNPNQQRGEGGQRGPGGYGGGGFGMGGGFGN